MASPTFKRVFLVFPVMPILIPGEFQLSLILLLQVDIRMRIIHISNPSIQSKVTMLLLFCTFTHLL